MWSLLMEQIRRQHQVDLEVYRSAHQNFTNRLLHWFFIPLETVGIVVIAGILARKAHNYSTLLSLALHEGTICATLGLLSIVVSPCWTGILVAMFHVAIYRYVSWYFGPMPPRKKCLNFSSKQSEAIARQGFILSAAIWTISWFMQVGLGHWIIEGNQPTVSNQRADVSVLAMILSILIAWKS